MAAGFELKQARELAGLSLARLSNSTKIQVHKLLALEEGDYSQLPVGIYLDGIVRAYAHEVGIDPAPILERVRLEQATQSGNSGERLAAAPGAHAGPGFVLSADDSLDDFNPEGEAQPPPADAPAAVPVERAPAAVPLERVVAAVPPAGEMSAVAWDDVDLVQLQAAAQEPREQARQRRSGGWLLPFLVLGGAATGLYAVYVSKALVDQPAQVAIGDDRTSQHGASETAKPALDSDSAPDVEKTSTPPRRAVELSSLPGAREDPVTRTRAVPDVTGSWNLATYVESSSYSRFAGLQLEYDLTLKQDGERIIGAGRKVTENGKRVARRAQTPIALDGTVTGDGVNLNFVERGTRRRTEGTLVLNLDDRGILRGRFSSEAAQSAGRAEAHPTNR